MIKQSKPVFLFYKYEKSELIEIDTRFYHLFFKPTLFNLKLHEGSLFIYLFGLYLPLGSIKYFIFLRIKKLFIFQMFYQKYSNILL